MTQKYALVPLDAVDAELVEAGVDPTARNEAASLVFIHSDDVIVWVGIEPVTGMIDLVAHAPGDYRSWTKRGAGGDTTFVNATRLVALPIVPPQV